MLVSETSREGLFASVRREALEASDSRQLAPPPAICCCYVCLVVVLFCVCVSGCMWYINFYLKKSVFCGLVVVDGENA